MLADSPAECRNFAAGSIGPVYQQDWFKSTRRSRHMSCARRATWDTGGMRRLTPPARGLLPNRASPCRGDDADDEAGIILRTTECHSTLQAAVPPAAPRISLSREEHLIRRLQRVSLYQQQTDSTRGTRRPTRLRHARNAGANGPMRIASCGPVRRSQRNDGRPVTQRGPQPTATAGNESGNSVQGRCSPGIGAVTHRSPFLSIIRFNKKCF